MNKKLFTQVVEAFSYSIYTIAIFCYKLGGVHPRAIFTALLSIVIAIIFSQIFMSTKICENNRNYASFFAVLVVWALVSFINHWEPIWYFFGFAIYIVSQITYLVVLSAVLRNPLKPQHFALAWKEAVSNLKGKNKN